MNEKSIWLRTSLFAHRSEWNYVLRDGIKSFLADNINKNEIENLQICFNYIDGDNIRFAVQVKSELCEQFANRIDIFFKSLFSKETTKPEKINPPAGKIFLPPPSKSILYGLYTAPIAISKGVEKIATKLSQHIILALESEKIDEETLITLAFYLNAPLITAFRKRAGYPVEPAVLYRYNNGLLNPDSVTQSFLVKKLAESQTTLADIIKSIFDHAQLHDTPYWLKTWISDCDTLATQVAKEEDLKTFINIKNLINNQLGLTPNMIKLLNYFIAHQSFA